MIKEGYLAELESGKIQGRYLLVMRNRGCNELAPSEQLLTDFMNCKHLLEKQYGKGSVKAHNEAFIQTDYECRFRKQILSSEQASAKLKEIIEIGQVEDIYLICFEGPKKYCHRRILLDIMNKMNIFAR